MLQNLLIELIERFSTTTYGNDDDFFFTYIFNLIYL